MTLNKEVYANFLLDLNKTIYRYKNGDFSELIFFCIGTNKIIGDSFGPLVGEKLNIKLKKFKDVFIYGDLNLPICISNLDETINTIKIKYKNPYIIAIDSAFSGKAKVGDLYVGEGGICAGKALNKKVKKVGNSNIKAIIAKDKKIPYINYKTLQNVSPKLVVELAEKTADGIYKVICK